MLKKIITLLLITIVVISANAQNISLTWGEESKNEVTYSSFVKGTSNDLIKLCFEEKGKKISPIITGYNSQLQELTNNTIFVDQDNVKFDRLLSVKGNLYFFTNIFDDKAKTTSFYCQPLDIKSFQNQGSNISLGTFSSIKKSNQSNARYRFSEDSTKVLMMGFSPYNKTDIEKYHIGVYNEKMTKLWDKTIELPYKDKDISVFGQLVTNDGKVAVLINHFNNQIKKGGKNTPNYDTKLLIYSEEEETPHEYLLDIGNKFMHSLSIASEKNYEITLFGTHKKAERGNIAGYFLCKINLKNKSLSFNNINDFPEALLDRIKNDKQGDKSGLTDNFNFVNSISRENGDQDFLLEFRRVQWVSSRYGSYYAYEHGDIIDINVKRDGTNIITRIPKFQLSIQNEYASSFKALAYKDKLLLFYNDTEKNLKLDLDERPKTLNLAIGGKTFFGPVNASLTMSTLDSGGNLTRTVLMNKKLSKHVAFVRTSLNIHAEKIALYATTGTKDIIGYLEVK